ncbi:MAG: exosome complex protein Rrp42 [Candidatus Bathyarchaeota archaeon]|nr:MAG: exosome complex protein Rrp42 [Candidatus Bathyarchaeota archaeon]
MSGRYGIVSKLKRKKIHEVVASGNRMDGRGLEEYREIVVRPNAMEKADGSAEVYLGKSRVLVGVSVEIGKPFEDTPAKGVLICNAEFTPIAHPTFEPGPPKDDSIELARVVDRGLRSAEILDFDKLCLIEGSDVYLVFVDLYVLSYDGNLIDASAMGAIEALRNTKMQVYKVKEGKLELTKRTQALKLLSEPLAVTIAKIGENLVVDPTADEEEVMDARLTITLDENGNVCTIQKARSEGFTMEEIKKALSLAQEKSAEIREKLKRKD